MDTHSADVLQRTEFGYTSLVEFCSRYSGTFSHLLPCLDYAVWMCFFAEAFVFFAEASKSVACRHVAFGSEACKSCVAFSLLVVPLVVGFSGVPRV